MSEATGKSDEAFVRLTMDGCAIRARPGPSRIWAAVGQENNLQQHHEETLHAGHFRAVRGDIGLLTGGDATIEVAGVQDGGPSPSLKPPFPCERSVDGATTRVNNVETLAHPGQMLMRGSAWYRGLGRVVAGTALFSRPGDALRPGLHESPMGTTLREPVFDHVGAMLPWHGFRAACIGVPSYTLLLVGDLDVPIAFENLRACWSRLGTGAMIAVG